MFTELSCAAQPPIVQHTAQHTAVAVACQFLCLPTEPAHKRASLSNRCRRSGPSCHSRVCKVEISEFTPLRPFQHQSSNDLLDNQVFILPIAVVNTALLPSARCRTVLFRSVKHCDPAWASCLVLLRCIPYDIRHHPLCYNVHGSIAAKQFVSDVCAIAPPALPRAPATMPYQGDSGGQEGAEEEQSQDISRPAGTSLAASCV